MPNSKPASSTGAVHSLKNDAHQTTTCENEKPDLPSLGTGTLSLLNDWLNTGHRHERIAVGLSLPLLDAKDVGASTKGKNVGGKRKNVDGEGKKGL